MKIRDVFLLLIIIIGVSSCKNLTDSKTKIGFLIHSTSNKRWAADLKYLNERAEELGATFIMKEAGGDENIQLKQAQEILDEDIDVLIVVAANQNTAGGIVRAAHAKKVKVISYDRMIKNADLDYLISFEYEKIGELMVEYVANRVPHGNCIALWGDPNDANAVFIKNGQQRAFSSLSEDKKLNVVYKSYVHGWNQAIAEKAVNNVLDFSNERIDAVISSNIPLGFAACNALSSHGYKPNEVVVTAMDASIGFIHSMLDGGITMTVTKPIKDLAYGAIDLAVDIAKGKNEEVFSKTVFNGRIDVPAKLFPPMVIDKSNFEKELIEKGFFTREEVFQNVAEN